VEAPSPTCGIVALYTVPSLSGTGAVAPHHFTDSVFYVGDDPHLEYTGYASQKEVTGQTVVHEVVLPGVAKQGLTNERDVPLVAAREAI
jgi:hypothetical protein